MASRKRSNYEAQSSLGLGLPVSTLSVDSAPSIPSATATRIDVDTSRPRPSADADIESFDDYDDESQAEDVDPPQPIPNVIVEMVGDAYEVSRLRDNGTTVACVMWTRTELEELRRRIDAALEMSK